MDDFELIAKCLMAVPLMAAAVICIYLIFSAVTYPVCVVIASFLIYRMILA